MTTLRELAIIGSSRHAENVSRMEDMASRIQEILEEVRATNGRVTLLEGWRNQVKGAWWMLSIVSGVVGYIVAKVLHW